MVQVGTLLYISDKSGISIGECIKVLGPGKKRIALLGDVILFSVKRIDLIRFSKLREKQKRKFSTGTIHRGLIIRTKSQFCRFYGVFIHFEQNSAIVINKNIIPISNRIFGPILKELCIKYPSVGCVARFII